MVERKVRGARMCECGLSERLHGSVTHEFKAALFRKDIFKPFNKRCARERKQKAEAAAAAEREAQRGFFDKATDFEEAFGP